VGDRAEILPDGLETRVRGIQTHGQSTQEAEAGTRVALNLAGVGLEGVERGDVCCAPGFLRPTLSLDARLDVLAPVERHFVKAMSVFGGAFPRATAAALGDLIGCACTINEPQGLGSSGYLLGINPPGHTDDREGAQRAVDNLLAAHTAGGAAIRSRYSIPVGVTLAMPDIQYEDGAQPGTSSLEVESRVNDWFLELARKDDFIGVQTYTRFRIGPEGSRSPGHDWSDLTRELTETDTITQMGYEDYPQALGGAIRRAAKSCPGIPILVTESGIATAHDERRIGYVDAALREVQACLVEGIDVRSYLYCSWMDNFECALGSTPTLGLVAVDRLTFARSPKPSAAWLGEVSRRRSLTSIPLVWRQPSV